jgi:hypothetical protein
MLSALVNASEPKAANVAFVEAVDIQRSGLHHLMSYIDSKPQIFNRGKNNTSILSRFERQQVLDLWVVYRDYMGTLQQLAEQSKTYVKYGGNERIEQKKQHQLAFNAHYRYSLEFISRINHDPEIQKWLNKSHDDVGLKKNTYKTFKKLMLSDWSTDTYDQLNAQALASSAPNGAIDQAIWQDRVAINNINRIALLTKQSASWFKAAAYNTWFPVQKNVAWGMGKVKFWRIGRTLITPDQALAFSRSFQPGDFYITRKEWRMTNLGIPGFWTHSALYIGTAAERERFFDGPDITAWVMSQGIASGKFEDLLLATSDMYRNQRGYDEQGEIRVIEALNPGVIFNSIETSLDADGAAVFRPKLSKLDIAKAIHGSFTYTGQPYDFHFDFDSDTAMVCSELIYKAYQSTPFQQGIDFPVNLVAGKKMLTPSEIAQWYEQTRNTPEQQIELVMFVDSNEKAGVAFESTEAAFIGSYKRPKWHVFQQPSIADIEKQIPNTASNTD